MNYCNCPNCRTDNCPNAVPDPFRNEEARVLDALLGSIALSKACLDPFDYALRLRTGEVIDFESASILNSEWVHLKLKPRDDQHKFHRIAYPADRGVDVRLSDIVWVMDAPRGS